MKNIEELKSKHQEFKKLLPELMQNGWEMAWNGVILG
jgi:hypothetical protein